MPAEGTTRLRPSPVGHREKVISTLSEAYLQWAKSIDGNDTGDDFDAALQGAFTASF